MIPDLNQPAEFKGRSLNQKPACDKLINSELMLQSISTLEKGKVVGRHVKPEEVIFCSHDGNPKLRSIVHDVEFSSVQVKKCAVNAIA